MRRAIALALAAASAGCIGELPPPSFVDRTRIVAARVSPDRDPTLAAPSPGDAITIEWLTIAPAPGEPIAATLLACTPLGGTGVPACAEGSIVPLAVRPPSTEPFVTRAVVPEAIGPAWLILGAVCTGGGTPGIPMGTEPPSCEGGPEPARAEVIALSIPITPEGGSANRHPTLADEPWTIGGAAWEPGDATGCDGSLPSFSLASFAGTEEPALAITIGWSEDDRETHAGGREALQYSHFATAGELERSNSAADDLLESGTPVTLDWALPPAADVPAEGLLVRLTTIARDGRGGVDRADRALCVTP